LKNDSIDIIYYLTDLTAESKRKILLIDESKDEIINLISNTFNKPLFNFYIKEKEKHLLEEKLNKFNFKKYESTKKFKMGDFLLQLEEAGEL
jgi:hypothetical protein